MRAIDADALLENVWDADTRCGYVQVVDAGDIEDAPTIEPKRKTMIISYIVCVTLGLVVGYIMGR